MTLVVKLGSSIVAGADGALRKDVLDQVCAQVAELHEGGEEIVMVTSGSDRPRAPVARASSSGPRRSTRSRPPPRSARDRCSVPTRSGSPRGDVRAAQVLLTAFDMSERINYLNARQTLQRLLAWHVVPVDQRERHHRDRRDHVRRQRLPLRAGRDHDRGPAADPAHRPDGPVQCRPPFESGRPAGRACGRHRGARELRDRLAGHRSSAPAGCAARSSPRRWPAARESASRSATAPRTGRSLPLLAASRSAPPSRAAHDRAPSFKLWLRWATPAQGRIVVDDGAGRVLRERGSSLLPVGITTVEGSFAAGDPVEVVDR